MRVLYGVVGEGLGHATRSRVVIEHLAAAGHDVRVVVSNRAHAFLAERLKGIANVRVHEIQGFSLSFRDAVLDLKETVLENIELMPRKLRKNLEVYSGIIEEGWHPQIVFSDYESWAFFYALNHRVPFVSIDNMQVLHRTHIDEDIARTGGADFTIARTAVRVKLPGAYHYLVTSFFYPEVRKPRTSLVPPILRPEILAAEREPGEHVLVYQTASANQELLPKLRGLPGHFVLYGLNKEGTDGNVTLRKFSEQGFVDDLRTAQGCIATGGFSLMSEAVHLRVPMLAVPLEGQFEQELNSRYLAKLGFGTWTPELDRDVIDRFLGRVDDHAQALQAYEPVDNSMTLACVDELVRCVDLDEPRPVRLQSPTRGAYWDEL